VHDGQKVVYAGSPGTLLPGDEGTMLASEATYAHVLWTTGALAGQVTLAEHGDLDTVAVRGPIEASLDDSLEVGSLHVISARDAYDEGGADAVVGQLAYNGQLSMLMAEAEEGIAHVVASVRHSPYLQQVAAQLDEAEMDELARVTSAVLIKELLGGEE
jgi:hypothetical protein